MEKEGKILGWHFVGMEDVFFIKVSDDIPEVEFTSDEVFAFLFGYFCSTKEQFPVSLEAIAINTRMLKKYDPNEYEDEQDLPV